MIVPHLVALVGAGASAEVFRISGGRVLKLYREGLDPGVVEREHDGVRHAQDQGLHVPRTFGMHECGNRRGIILEEVRGTTLLRALPLRVPQWRPLLRRFADYHAMIHRCSGEGLRHAQHDIVRVRIEQAAVSEHVRREALERLEALPRGDRLCHGDFHPGNALLTRHGIAAIDWSNGCSGDPAGDVARTELLFRYSGFGRLLRTWPNLNLLRPMAASFYLAEYLRRTAIDEARVAAWRIPIAVAALVPDSRVHRPSVLQALARMGVLA
jgi:aminoglycoside phosphotransferase (APT) family kinase protein